MSRPKSERYALRTQLRTTIARAIAAQPSRDPWVVAVETVQEQGMRRAVWAALPQSARLRLVARATKDARKIVWRACHD
jgi:hypothetical protein